MGADGTGRNRRHGERVTLADVVEARQRIAGLAAETPLKPSEDLSRQTGRSVRLKLETAQPTGAFKLRGAANAILELDAARRRRGVVAQSSGNHGRAVAWVARELGIPATVFLPTTVPDGKVEAVRRLGAEIVATEGGHEASIEQALRFARREEKTFVPPFDDPAVIAGQGTVALELLEQWPEVDSIVVPLSGGGLLAGIAVVVKALRPEIELIGVSMAVGATMVESLRAGRMLRVAEMPTLADALAGEIPLDNRHTFALCRDLVDRVVTVEEEAIRAGLRWALSRERLVIEGGAAVGLAWLLGGREPIAGDRVAVVLTGDNVDFEWLLGEVGFAPAG